MQDTERDEGRYCDAEYLGQILRSPSSSPRELWLFITPELWDSPELLQRHQHTRQLQDVCLETLCVLCKYLHSFLLITRSLLKRSPWPTGLESEVSVFLCSPGTWVSVESLWLSSLRFGPCWTWSCQRGETRKKEDDHNNKKDDTAHCYWHTITSVLRSVVLKGLQCLQVDVWCYGRWN